MTMEELRKQFGLPETSMVIPEHTKAVYTMADINRLEAAPSIEKRPDRMYSDILKREVPTWMLDMIEEALHSIPRNATKCFVSSSGQMFNKGLRECNSHYNAISVYDDIIEVINKHFSPIGISAHTCRGGSNKHPKYELRSKFTNKSSDQFEVGVMSLTKWHQVTERIIVSSEKLYSKLYKLLFNYVSDCAKNHLSAVIPCEFEEYVSQWEAHRDEIKGGHDNALSGLDSQCKKLEERIRKCKSYNALSVPVDIRCSCARISSWSTGNEFTFHMVAGNDWYEYGDRNIHSSCIALDADIIYSMNDDALVDLCKRVYGIKIHTVKEYYGRSHYMFRNYSRIKFTNDFKLNILDPDPYLQCDTVIGTCEVDSQSNSISGLGSRNPKEYICKLEEKLQHMQSEYDKLKVTKLEYGERSEYPDKVTWF